MVLFDASLETFCEGCTEKRRKSPSLFHAMETSDFGLFKAKLSMQSKQVIVYSSRGARQAVVFVQDSTATVQGNSSCMFRFLGGINFTNEFSRTISSKRNTTCSCSARHFSYTTPKLLSFSKYMYNESQTISADRQRTFFVNESRLEHDPLQ